MKNFKLLLATTAMLSMGAVAVNATSTNISGAAAQLQASVKFMEPVSITQTQALHFGTLIHPTGGQTVIWNPSSTSQISSGSTAQQAFTSGAQAPKIGIMTYTGPNLSLTDEGSFNLFFSSTENGTQSNSATITLSNGSGESAKTCGSVNVNSTLATMPNHSAGTTATTKSINNNDQIYIGGIFTVDEGYDSSISYGECKGSVYVTLVINN